MRLFASNVVLEDALIVEAVGGGGEGIINEAEAEDEDEVGGVYSAGEYGGTYEAQYEGSSIQPSVAA